MTILNIKSEVPEGKSGDWSVSRFTVNKEEEEMNRLQAVISSSQRGRCVPMGTYTCLRRNGTMIMSDTPDELRDILHAVYRAKDHVLINGLGLGIIAELCLQNEGVSRVTVIEISSDVITLVGPCLKEKYSDKVEIIHVDAFKYKPPKGVRYGMVWHDIWDNICGDNLPDMHKLHRKYGRRTEWQGSWCRERIDNR